jgi:heat shock protein HtpX
MIAFVLFALCSLAFSIGLSLLAFAILHLFGLSLGGADVQYLSMFIYSLVLGCGGALTSLMLSRKMAVWTMGVQLIDRPQNEAEMFIVREIEALSNKLGLKMPQVGIFMSDQINAFATGPTKNRALVAVSSGLIEQMTAEEARAVLAHEMAHVKSGDMFWMTIISGVSNSLVLFASYILSKLVVGSLFEKDSFIAGFVKVIIEVVLQMVLGLFAMIFVMAFSRYREYRADAQAAQWVGRNDMIAALQRLNQNHNTEESMPASMQAFGIFGSKAGMFASHPALDERIEALRNRQYAK